MRKYALCAAAATVIGAVVIAGCGHQGGSSSGVAEINGQSISYEDFGKQMAQTPAAAMVLNQMLESKLIIGLAEKNGVAPTDEQINQRIEFTKKISDLDTQLKQSNTTMDEYKEQQKAVQAQINVAEKLVKPAITDADVKADYDAKQHYDIPERMRTEMAMFMSKDAADKAAKAMESGTSAEQAAKDQGGQGAIQSVPKMETQLPPQIFAAVFNSPMGKVSQPVKMPSNGRGPDTYIVFKPLEKQPALKFSLKEVEPIIRGKLAVEKAQSDTEFQKMLAAAHKDAKITISLTKLKDAEKQFRTPVQAMPQGMQMMPPKGAPAPKK